MFVFISNLSWFMFVILYVFMSISQAHKDVYYDRKETFEFGCAQHWIKTDKSNICSSALTVFLKTKNGKWIVFKHSLAIPFSGQGLAREGHRFFSYKCFLQCCHSDTISLLPLSHICHSSPVSYLNAFPLIMPHLVLPYFYLLLSEITLYGHFFLIETVSHETSNARHLLHEIKFVCMSL